MVLNNNFNLHVDLSWENILSASCHPYKKACQLNGGSVQYICLKFSVDECASVTSKLLILKYM